MRVDHRIPGLSRSDADGGLRPAAASGPLQASRGRDAFGIFTPRSSMIFACTLFATAICLRLAGQYFADGGLYLEDDAYYYIVVARNIVQSGLSSFDGQTLTNGYHPLWLLIVVAQDLLFGSSPYLTVAIELVLGTAGLWFFLASFRTSSPFFRFAFAIAYMALLWPLTAKGMEITLLAFSAGLFTRLAVQQFEGRDRGLALGLAALLCIGARLDAAVFILPTLLLVLGSSRRMLVPLALIGVVGALYAGANLWLFGLPFPISGAIKSLGGLQWNQPLAHQLAGDWASSGVVAGASAFVKSAIGRAILLTLLAGIALPFTGSRWKSRPLLLGYLAGFALFAIKLMAFSSWMVWPWYAFPGINALAALFHLVDDVLASHARASRPRGDALAAAVLAVLFLGIELRRAATEPPQLVFEMINREAVSRLGPVLAGARVAMGDRAGSFAFHYPGPVTQLEGLVNDRAYLEALQSRADIRTLLCKRGVRYVLAYQRDLGPYETVSVPIMRPSLTQFPAPALTFSRQDEVGRVFDLAKYDNSALDEGDNYLYAWRLSGCGADH